MFPSLGWPGQLPAKSVNYYGVAGDPASPPHTHPHFYVGTEQTHPWVKGCQQAPVHPVLGSQAPRAPCNSGHLPCNQWVTGFLILETPQIPAGKWDLSSREGRSVCECQSPLQHKGGLLEQLPTPLISPDLKATLQRVGGASSMPTHSCLNLERERQPRYLANGSVS